MTGPVVIFSNQKGPLPLTATFKSPSDGPVILAVSGSAWTQNRSGQLIGINISVDNKHLGSAIVYCNEPASHKALIPVLLPTQLSFDEHTLTITAQAGTVTDFNDYFNVVLTF
jgi:hypothetical protein